MSELIKTVNNESAIETAWRNMLALLSDLELKRVLNGHSVRGVDLQKRITSTVQMSLDLHDCMIIFEVDYRQDEKSMTEEQEDSSLLVFTYFVLKISIYGAECAILGNILKARLESEKCRQTLFDAGIYFEKVASIDEVHDFMNETIWPRLDMSINFGCRLSITQVDDYDNFEHASVDTTEVNKS